MPPPSAATIEQMIRQGESLAAAGRMREAARVLQDTVNLAPRSAPAHAALGWAYAQLVEHHRAAPMLRKAVALDGTRAESHFLLGTTLQVTGPIEEALTCFERAIALKPTLPGPYGGAASIYERSSQNAKARQLIEKGMKAVPGDVQLKVIYAGMRVRDGENETARDELRAIIASNPTPPLPALARAWHTLATSLDKLSDYDGAFQAFTACNELRAQYPQSKWSLENDNVTPFTFGQMPITAEQCRRWADAEPADGLPTPAFLVGFPRSGTTMTEQVLGAHPRVVATPERGMLQYAVGWVEQAMRQRPGTSLVEVLDSMTADEITENRKRYWEAAKQEIDAGRKPLGDRVLVDKYPVHVGKLGLINRVFPRARVIVALRDPRDCCLSAYTQFFAHNPAMVRFLRLDTTARMYHDLLNLYLTLRDRLTTPLLTVRYEDTVEDLEGQSRRMLEFLGVPWDDAVLSPEQRAKSRYVNTPSWQTVSSKVNTRAKGRWTRYRKHLEPILPVLEPFVKEFGYEPTDAESA